MGNGKKISRWSMSLKKTDSLVLSIHLLMIEPYSIGQYSLTEDTGRMKMAMGWQMTIKSPYTHSFNKEGRFITLFSDQVPDQIKYYMNTLKKDKDASLEFIWHRSLLDRYNYRYFFACSFSLTSYSSLSHKKIAPPKLNICFSP